MKLSNPNPARATDDAVTASMASTSTPATFQPNVNHSSALYKVRIGGNNGNHEPILPANELTSRSDVSRLSCLRHPDFPKWVQPRFALLGPRWVDMTKVSVLGARLVVAPLRGVYQKIARSDGKSP